MADAYWRYGEARPPLQQQPLHPLAGKRPRSEFDIPGAHDRPGYFPDERGAQHGVKDTDSIGASYDRYLRNSQIPSYGVGDPGRSTIGGGVPGYPGQDPRMMGMGSVDPGLAAKPHFESGRPGMPLPPDATSTLFVEGLPSDCKRREIAHIFRPFVGYKEARLVSKDAKHSGDPLVLCFVDFASPAHAATALDALQGYKFDEHDRDSVTLRIQFARYPGARSGGGLRSKR